ncbi:ribonuclease YeeF family protein [Fictibacillus nanhaiensis]|uniref:ribonuclease YeeF family protein n=1 Tax=Fictibacillus nanhaiensis TaxID=742169 RepID=UPI003C1BFD6F
MGSHVLEASTLNAATGERAHQYERLREQFQTLKTELAKIADDSDFQGKGAEAIKGFYQGQIDVVDAWIQLIDINVLFFKGIPGDTEDVDLSGDTVVQVPFLEENVERAGRMAKDIVADQQDALQQIFSDISDLVSLSVFSKDAFEDEMDKAEKRRLETVEKVNELDQRLTDEYAVSQGQEQYIYALFAQLMEATRQGENISPLYFNAEAYLNSEVYKAITKVKEENDKYINFKKEQKEAREIQKEMEEMENRPWYEKAWDTVSTFTGEVTGYYDSIRASTGVDPVTGRKLSEAERITAGAMAAAGFIPVIGWAGRAVKGGSAIYKTVKAANTADHMLDSYKTAQGLTRLQKAEYGIYGLVSANGFGEYFTGKDMFGNELSEEQRNQSLFNAFAIAGVGSAGYGLDRMDIGKVLQNKFPLNRTNKIIKKFEKDIDKHPQKEIIKDVLKYVEKKQISVSTQKLLDEHVVKEVINRVGPNLKRSDISNLKWEIIEKSTIRNKEKLTPSQRARLWQGSSPYFGLDEYEDFIMSKGTKVYTGYPFPTGYSFTKTVLDSVNGDSKELFQGVQVNPRVSQDGTGDYKYQIIAFEFLEDIPSARGITNANPQLGNGGLEQIFTPDFKELVRDGKVIPILNDETIKMLKSNGIEFDKELLQLIDSEGNYIHKSICDTFISIADDKNIVKLENNILSEEEVLDIEKAIEKVAKNGGGIY